MKIYFSDKIVLPDEVTAGYISVYDGIIIDIKKGERPTLPYVDLSGKYVFPGFINLESKEYFIEEKSAFNKNFSEDKIFRQIDKMSAEAGVTTNFHMLTLESMLEQCSSAELVEKLKGLKFSPSFKSLVDHKVHVFFKLGDKNSNKALRELINEDVVDFVTCTSIHSYDMFNYRNQYFVQNLQRRFDLSEEESAETLNMLIDLREQSALDDLSYRIKIAKRKKIPFAANRYSFIKRLKEEYKIDMNIISGKHTPKTRKRIKENGLHYLYSIEAFMDWTSDISLSELLSEKVVDIITTNSRSNDILEYVFMLEEMLGLPEAIKMFSLYPAQVANLDDRGQIAVGKRADFVIVESIYDRPSLVATVSAGRPVVKYNYK